MRIFYLALLSIFCLNAAKAQVNDKKTTINGHLTDEQQKPLEYATVGLFKAADSSLVKTAFTTPDGKFQLLAINAGSYYIKVNMMGYQPYLGKSFTVADNLPVLNMNAIALKQVGNTLKTVNVTAVKPLLERKADKLVMNVENSSTAVGSTAFEVLQKAPGVTVDQNENITMQGKQGVLIMLDGKSTYMSNADVANLLKNMQSSEVESIELITNPSSKYDAAGNAGIINIKTKRNKNAGANGSFNVGAGYGKNFRMNTGLNLNYRNKHINVFGNYNYGNVKRENFLSIDRIANGTPNVYFSQNSTTVRTNNSNNFKAGVDYYIDKNNIIGFLATGYLNSGKENGDANTNMGKYFGQIDSLLISDSKEKRKYNNFAYNVNYKSVLDTIGQEISVDLDYSNYTGDNSTYYTNRYLYADQSFIRPINYIRNTTPSDIKIKAFKVDYALPLGKSAKLEAGVKSSWVKTDNNLIAEELKNDNWQNDVRRSNRFVYDENVNAVYASINKEFKGFSIQAGLRMEQTNSKGNLITTNNVVERSYWDFFPTVYLQKTINKDNQLGLSYGRRVDRPSYDDLNPFVYYLDEYAYNKGNPFLNPQYTHNIELNYTFKQKYLLTAHYSRVNDAITQVLLPDEEKKALYQTNANLAKNIVYGVNLYVPVKIAKWWNMNNTLNTFHIIFESPNLGGKNLENRKTAMQYRMQNNFIIVDGLTAETMANYESPVDYGTLSLKSRYSFDIGFSKSLMQKKASLRLAVSDLFNISESNLKSAYPGLSYDLYQKNESRVVRLSFNYRFGKNEIKPARRRTTGTEDEQGRMKN
ncbi:TonB-dependent receptor [Pedobacter montanisoli]|uniref:TonB-dependent receptor n=1 Tax=Pedobacter montanisoli TaxID=2923277 RepID=A0ABS9ZT75_9SPHI|nr:TonB-dependent receptor [Pedobacter montanisoli]MCJ0741791.1 TonB-dependent receptor [Pedobacter montanisoli]